MSIKELMLKSGGKWLFTLQDKSKWIIDLDNMLFDNYKWYNKVGTIESDLDMEQFDNFMKQSKTIRKIGV